MNKALWYLWLTLLKHGALQFARKLRRPSTSIGFAALVFAFGVLFHFRHERLFSELLRREMVIGCALLMLGGSVFKGFLQRGLVFEVPDLQFVFIGPFTRPQIILYRLLPAYLYSVAQAGACVLLLAPHLQRPVLAFSCLTFFQAACFHISAGAAIVGGRISPHLHNRIRCMMLAAYAVTTALYLRTAWDLKLAPAFATSALAQLLFYPAVSLPDVAATASVQQFASWLVQTTFIGTHWHLSGFLLPLSFALLAMVSLWWVLGLKGNLFESSLAATEHSAARRARLREGLAVRKKTGLESLRLPSERWFGAAKAIIWKNFTVAGRSKRELLLAAAFTSIYTGFLIALRWLLRHYSSQGGGLPQQQVRDFDLTLIGLLAFLPFFLQRAFPFDFRRDGQHLATFRSLPIGGFAIALAELAVPIALCLLFQAISLLALIIVARFEWQILLFILLAFPAVALGLNGVWNVHYLLAATRRAGGKAESASPVTLLMIVVLSFLVFYPAAWLALEVGRNLFGPYSESLAVAVWLATQYLVDLLLLLLLARLFRVFEIAREG